MKNMFLYIILLSSFLLSQSRSIIYNNGDPDGDAGHSIYWDGEQGNSASNKFTVTDDYVLEAFSIWASLNSPFGSLRVVLQNNNNESPGEELGQWSIALDGLIPSREYFVLTTGECIFLDKNESYWLTVHADNENTDAIWLFSPQSFYSYSTSQDYGSTWAATLSGQAGAGTIAGEKIFYNDISPNTGDVNFDSVVNVLDAVSIVQYILDNVEYSNDQLLAADLNGDQTINVLDVVGVVSSILSGPEEMPQWLLEDLNPNSSFFGQMVGPETFSNEVSIYYFGKQG